jgi:ribosomal protein S13
MVYIFNKYIDPQKTVKIALTTILGIGKKNSQKITNSLCINPNHRF